MRRTNEGIEWIKSLFDNPTLTIVFHNAKFDLSYFMLEGVDIFNCAARVECTLILSKLYNMNGAKNSHSLENLARKYCGRDTKDKTDIIDWLKAHNTKKLVRERGRKLGFDSVPDDLLHRRVLWDVESTILLWHALRKPVGEACPDLLETELALQYVCINMESRGVMVDIIKARTLRKQAKYDTEQLEAVLDDIVLPFTVVKKKGGVSTEVEITDHFNVNSAAHKIGVWQKVGIELKYKTKPKKKGKSKYKVGGGNWSFDEYAMMRYVPKQLAEIMREANETGWTTQKFVWEIDRAIDKYNLNREHCILPAYILRAAQLRKMVSTYYNKIINESVDQRRIGNREVGILHCKFNQSEALTGRFSSSDPNLQNIPRILGPRQCFIPRPGRRNWHVDYSQVEMKFFVHFAKDPKMAKAIEHDIHLYTATQIYHKPAEEVTKEQRKRAKGTNFGIIYGSGPETQAETLTRRGLPTTIVEAKQLVLNYHRAFPSVRRITNELESQLYRKGYVVNPFGRRYHISTQRGYTALNYMCQGTSADQIKQAMVKIWRWLRDEQLKTQMIMTVHDEVVLEVPQCEETTVLPRVKEMMEDLDSYYVPITVDFEVATRRWSEKRNPEELYGKLYADKLAI